MYSRLQPYTPIQERAEGDYASSRVSGGSRFVPWVISKKERALLPIGTLRKLRKLECEVGQPAERGQSEAALFGRACQVLSCSTHSSGEPGFRVRGCDATAYACQGLRFGTLDTQDARERKKLPGSVNKLLKGYELRAWWFEIFECGRKAQSLAASNMPPI